MDPRLGTLGWCIWLALAGLLGPADTASAQEAASSDLAARSLAECNVVWETTSQDSSGSMPIGNGDIGLNVWMEENGDLVFYVAKTDAFSENGQLLKLGRIRVALKPNPFLGERPFRQELRLREGEILITAGHEGKAAKMRLWVDANRPVVRLETHTQRPTRLRATLQSWRLKRRTLDDPAEQGGVYELIGSPDPIVVDPDTILPAADDRITWYHRNTRSTYRRVLENQHLGPLLGKYPDPLLNRTFGCLMKGSGLVASDDQTLHCLQPAREHLLSIYALTAQTNTAETWLDKLADTVASVDATDLAAARAAHRRWWDDFWKRSWICVLPTEDPPVEPLAQTDSPLRIGADSNGHNGFVGQIARARVWSEALTSQRVAALAQAGPRAASPPQADGAAHLVADFAFQPKDEGVFSCSAGSGLVARPVGQVAVVNTPKDKAIELNGQGYLQVTKHPRLDLTASISLEAWARPDNTAGRLIDKTPAGTSHGYLLDTYPGNALRSIIRPGTLQFNARLKPGQWAHLVSTFDAVTGRHCLYVDGKLATSRKESADVGNEGLTVTRGYALTRWMLACAGRGPLPMKFNGSLFTVDAPGGFNADFRAWGGNYWFQNQRLLYWPMLASGDFDLMAPWLKMYRDALPMAVDRTRLYCNHEGAYFYETMYFWGTANNNNFGWGNPGHETVNTYIRYYWQGGLELTAMMLDRHDFTGDDEFARNTLLPIAEAVTTFYDQHYRRDQQGKIRFAPAQSLETWHSAVNPTPVIAGLRHVLSRLLALPESMTQQRQRAVWRRLLSELPPLPIKQIDGKRRILPAETYSRESNAEGPELYAVYPYRLYGLGKADLELARNTFEARKHKASRHCWWQHGIWAAHLGLTDQARYYLLGKFTSLDGGQRFPAFWKPSPDWVPDMDNGGAGMITLQSMLLQTDGDVIRLLPAWPKTWDVSFKLHAPQQTTVECVYRDGRIQSLRVVPESRLRDVKRGAGLQPAK